MKTGENPSLGWGPATSRFKSFHRIGKRGTRRYLLIPRGSHPILIGSLLFVGLWTILGVVPLTHFLLTAANAQSKGKPSVAKDRSAFTGAGSCASSLCHGGIHPKKVPDIDIHQNELTVWMTKDKHAKAYEILLDQKSVMMARNLKLPQKAEKSDQCLACHALNVPKNLRMATFDITDGVSCETCHGPAEDWLEPHTARDWTYEKSLEAGMYDLKDWVKRAERCLSCHIGDDDKDVNHKMIAAGHPDLIFELDTFTALLPPHWREPEDPWYSFRAWGVGQAVGLRQSMEQLARRAGSEAWPEFAEFDCYACHHELRDDSWRQIRGYSRTPGSPPWNVARYAVFRHLIDQISPDSGEELEREISTLIQLLDKLGKDPEKIAALAIRAGRLAGQLAARIAIIDFNQRRMAELIRDISGDGEYLSAMGIRAAEQTALALDSLFFTYRQNTGKPGNPAIDAAMQKLFDVLEKPEKFRPEKFEVQLREVHGLFTKP